MTMIATPKLPRQHSADVTSEIKYRYAFDVNRRLVEINSSLVVKGKDYICLSCNRSLLPIKGPIRQQHFRHKVHGDCSMETYLHSLAKLVFQQTYNDCLLNREPFLVEYKVPLHCSACKNHVGYESKQVDLTKYFTKITPEIPDRGFIPDLLLTSDASNDSLYVEIAVTHFVEENKASSGARIIEISISEESDIDLISSCCISEEDPRVSTYNFKKDPLLRPNLHTCQSDIAEITVTSSKRYEPSIPSFFLFKNSGKCLQKNCTKSEYDNLSARSNYSKMLDIPGADSIENSDFLLHFFVENIQKAHLAGNRFKNCWLCNFHRRKIDRANMLGTRHWHTYSYSYCNKHKRSIENSNNAVDCKEFWIINNLKPEDDLHEYNRIRTAKFMERKIASDTTMRNNNYTSSQQIIPNQDDIKCLECGKITSKQDTWWFSTDTKTCICTKCLKLKYSHLL